MRTARFDGSFEGWRSHARALLLSHVAPHEVNWASGDESAGLFDDPLPDRPIESTRQVRIPKPLLDELEMAARYRVENRWSLLYRVLWRVSQGDSTARLVGDIDGSELHARIKAVRREAHHLHAFVRFSPVQQSMGPRHVAWFEPAHNVLPWAAEHFAERMGENSWLIATPDDGVCWDGQQMYYARPCPAEWRQLALEAKDPGGELWKAYYESTFNPSRLNRSVMESNLPVRFWKNLPEGVLIPQLMSRARAGAQRDGQSERVAEKTGKRIGRPPEQFS
ncbi:TIGR03915 family putative DNA repair protein [Stutzerimonas stutzeri]|uniref:TIGR03915 family putative DNA repair protein n=1 Tax=Stutzerimonas stutzeri TaxID=316 RepID=UPI00210D076B|nr:TIGR03915 family putative DNA repair protein [Stutzerimonas stutzeri]MCQ4256841.1 TIGR03915 family putative DNA repair protein [Stutzerimonas stutzeri]